MIRFAKGDLLDSGADALVNPVNCVGAMGAGLAAQFARRWPGIVLPYRRRCLEGLQPGELHVVGVAGPTWIVNAPTKRDWRDPSDFVDVTRTIAALQDWLEREPSVTSIAVPALGCGLGGLAWSEVGPVLVGALAQVPGLDVLVYAPPVVDPQQCWVPADDDWKSQ